MKSKRLNGIHQEFLTIFKSLTNRNSSWRVWSDFIELTAISISNGIDPVRYQERERRYMEVIKHYSDDEAQQFARLLAMIVQALEADPEQDFLGEIFMSLELWNHWKGQYFTPYYLSRLMAQLQIGQIHEKIEKRGFISVNDCACGAGAMLIAFANEAKKVNVNYQKQVLFVAQDIDQTAALMCYIQLSLLGCPGYVIIGNTLTEPPTEPLNSSMNVWYTPFYMIGRWK
ncbi:N-6 DNA methylase [Paenibacillus sp. GCM10012307]|uniref:site-specific DNA-methyltransferase (adenine-specific) n=1 Tax=Paenibacillus roseus TaxID=2798579 RepID=A0A934IYW2_9BACL|nr:N-6 DNA methylase [Paenibacillus roseus]MBJ6361757.1 N-6 DNA methylase [Paenibacillus roseus]